MKFWLDFLFKWNGFFSYYAPYNTSAKFISTMNSICNNFVWLHFMKVLVKQLLWIFLKIIFIENAILTRKKNLKKNDSLLKTKPIDFKDTTFTTCFKKLFHFYCISFDHGKAIEKLAFSFLNNCIYSFENAIFKLIYQCA